MPLPLSERPPAPAVPKAPKPAPERDAAYEARWGVTPTGATRSFGDERRAPAPVTGGPVAPGAMTEMNRLLGITPPSPTSAVGTAPSTPTSGLNPKAFVPGQVQTAEQILTEAQKPDMLYNINRMAGRDGGSMTVPENAPMNVPVDKAEAMLAGALRERREEGIGADKPNKVPLRKKVDRMTVEEYNALTPIQRAAVDFNGMLYTAVKRDKTLRDDYKTSTSPSERDEYDKTVEEMFGPDGGSKRYAPETVAVLAQIGYKDDSGDLDDYLGLKAAVREKDLKFLADSKDGPAEPATQFFGDPSVPTNQPEGLNEPRLDRVALARDIATKTREMQEALVKGATLLQSINLTSRVERAYLTDKLGGTPATPAPAELGYAPASFVDGVPQDLNSYYQLAFDKLAQGDKGALDGMKADLAKGTANGGISQQEYDTFWAYANNRSQNADAYGANLGNATGVTYISPEQFREMLGLDPKEGGR